MANPVRVLVIDDSAYNRKSIAAMLEGVPGVQVVGRLEGQNTLIVTITHLTEFALFGRSRRFLYLPLVLK